MRRPCARCGAVFDAKRSTAKWCSKACSVAASKEARTPVGPPGGETRAAVLAELTTAGRVKTSLGAMAIALADRVDQTPGSGAAALVKELRVTLAEAVRGAVVTVDAADELQARRVKRAAG